MFADVLPSVQSSKQGTTGTMEEYDACIEELQEKLVEQEQYEVME